MRLIDADKIDFSEVFIGQSDFARETRQAAQMLIDHQPTITHECHCNKWHIVSDGDLPTEHESMFAKYKGTERWSRAMFEAISDDVIAVIKTANGREIVKTAHTADGIWTCDYLKIDEAAYVVAWIPFPDPYK